MARSWNARWMFGNLVTFIIVYFIYLYADGQAKLPAGSWGWGVLAFITKWYLIISVVLVLISILIPVLLIVLALIISWRQRKARKKGRKSYIDVDYEIKD